MPISFVRAFRSSAIASVAAIAIIPAVVFAQDAAEADQKDEDIVVTGTLVRGIAPAGANVLATTSKDIEATGASTVAQLLQTIPQLGSFNGLQQPLAISGEVTVNRPNLRSLPGFSTASGSTTLVLMDGHRLVGMGVGSTTPDPDIIPPAVIERLEIVPDGGSAIYGSDAVAGVMNFVTIKRFDGVKVDGSYGFADDYYSWDANITAGRDWGSGSAFVSYAYVKTDDILGKDRDYIKSFPGSNGYTELRCSPGNIEALAGVFAPAGSVTGVSGGAVNQCDASDYATVYPKSERHSVFAGLTQQLNDELSVELRGYYTNRKTHVQSGPYRSSQIISPFPIPGVPSISSPYSGFGSANLYDIVQQADFQFGPNDAQQSDIELDTWGVSSNFAYDLGHGFQLRVLGNYGESTTSSVGTTLNEPALQNAIVAGLFNPYDPASSNPAAVGIVTNMVEAGRTRQRLINFRSILDGDLFDAPGGAAKIAVGLEYSRESLNSFSGRVVPGFEYTGAPAQYVGTTLVAPATPGLARFDVSRNVKSAFGELVVPILDETNGVGLTVSAAGRYDDYSDVGGTFNPRFGATLKPTDWISIRGAWGKSFNAPGLGDAEQAGSTALFILSGAAASYFAPPASLTTANGGPYPVYNGGQIVAIRGNAPGIEPQKATTWSVGVDIEPPVVSGLRLSATYYNIFFKNFIGLPPFENPALLYRDYGNVITVSPSQALLDAALANSDFIAQGNPPLIAAGTYAFFDARKRNLGDYKLDGIDFGVNYITDASFGSVFFNVNGTYELNRKSSNVSGGDYTDVLSNNANRLRSRTTVGAQVGPVLGQISWNFSQGYDLDPAVGYIPQAHVGSFSTFDLFMKLDVPGEGWGKDLSFNLNVNNLFDQDPPEYRGGISVGGQSGVPQNFLTLGRFIKLGVTKKF